MMSDPGCDRIQLEISSAHDEARPVASRAQTHIRGCDVCAEYAAGIEELDRLLARGRYDRAPDIASRVLEQIARPRTQWWSIVAIALVGLLVGSLVGLLGSRVDTGLASDLEQLFHTAGAELDGLSADLLVVERGTHPDVPERVYVGAIDYVAPEQLSIRLVDTTDYPDESWTANDVELTISNGDTVTRASSPCPVAALPGCLTGPMTRALADQPPFDDGVRTPLEIVGPGQSLAWPESIEVLGTTELAGRPAIQVRSTVAAIELIGAITDRGAWRDLHPTDPVVMWLDEATLVPLRIEVFAAETAERDLWQLRRGYSDDLGADVPLFVIELTRLATEPGMVDLQMPEDPPSQEFTDSPVEVYEPDLPSGFEAHRSGHRPLGDGGRVDVASWSDGRSWLMVESTAGWAEPRLFGLSLPFVEPIDLGAGSIGYLSPSGDEVAVHAADVDVLISGSVPRDDLLNAAASLDVEGLPVPDTWLEAATVDVDELPAGTFVPRVDGWSVLGRMGETGTTILLTGGGDRKVVIEQEPGTRLAPPTGPDFSEIRVRGFDARHDASASTLEWIEDGQIIRLTSETVGVGELVTVAEALERR